MKKIAFFFLAFFMFKGSTSAQEQTTSQNYSNPMAGKFLITAEGGATGYVGDFNKLELGYLGSFGFEYYFDTSSRDLFGLKAIGSYGRLKGSSDNGSFLGGELPGRITEFRTDYMDAKLGLVYAWGLGDFMPYISAGANGLFWYEPKNTEGAKLYKDDQDVDIGYYGELGFKFLVAKGLTLNMGATYHGTGTDRIDGAVLGDKKDAYVTGTLGFSVLIGGVSDSDGDGVPDDIDKCPDTPLGVKVDLAGCPIDSDGDGVPDYLDKCPETPSGAAVDKDGCPLDSDGDGVPDYIDKCPGTPAGIAVDKTGCPLDSDSDGVPDYLDKCPGTPSGVAVDKDGCPLDSDSDGVPDYLDKCPGTPAGIAVDKTGCPLDSDGDGVPDYLDKCPGTPRGSKVDANGCPTEITLEGGTTFMTGKSTLTESAKADLQAVVKALLDNPGTKWKIVGYTDNVGSEKSNQKLSEARAKAVMNYFVKLGVAKSRLSFKGMGAKSPIADNSTPEGRQQNRRVVITKAQ